MKELNYVEVQEVNGGVLTVQQLEEFMQILIDLVT